MLQAPSTRKETDMMPIGKQPCLKYQTTVTFFIETLNEGSRNLVARYDDYKPKARDETYPPDLPRNEAGYYQFKAGIPNDWTEQDVLHFLSMGNDQGDYPLWEIPARYYGRPILSWPWNWRDASIPSAR